MKQYFKAICASTCIMVCGNINVFGASKLSELNVSVVNNVFCSEKSPKLKIAVSNDFNYIGNFTEGKDVTNGDPAGPRSHNTVIRDSYIFVNQTPTNSEIKIFCISILTQVRPNWSFAENLFEILPEDRYIEKGKYKIGDNDYKYAVCFGSAFSEEMVNFIKNKGITLPPYYLLKIFENVSIRGNTKISITYSEDVLSSGNSSNNWRNISMFNESQKETIQAFLQRSSETFKSFKQE